MMQSDLVQPTIKFRVCDNLRLDFGADTGGDIPFLGAGNIWVEEDYTPSTAKLVRTIIYKALAETDKGQLDITIYDGNLSGIFAPFSALSSGSQRVIEELPDVDALRKRLDLLWQQIQAVQNEMQGRYRSLTSFRQAIGRPVEGYHLLVFCLDMSTMDQQVLMKLQTIMRAGAPCGFNLLIVSPPNLTLHTFSGSVDMGPFDLDGSISQLVPVDDATYKLVDSSGETTSHSYVPIRPEVIAEFCKDLINDGAGAQSALGVPNVVAFHEVQDLRHRWQESSVEGVTFAIGKYGNENVDITLGDEVNQRHNALITGAVGQGKSNLISLIVHSLCQRYSPDELQLYLLDFKEGVTLKPFSNIGKEDYLPHAVTLGLESDVTFGRSVLETLWVEYKTRMRRLKDASCRSLRDLRLKYPSVQIPRIVVIIDEFQLMIGEDQQTAQDTVAMLEKAVRLYRAAGIHFILASQTIGGNVYLAQKSDAIFGQVPIRIALKNSLAESQLTLGIGNVAASYLHPHEAIVNLDYGEPSQNKKTVIAFADERELAPLRHSWWEAAKDGHPAPYVFQSEVRVPAQQAPSLPEDASAPQCSVLLGQCISVRGEAMSVPLENEPGRNIALFGSPDQDCDQGLGVLEGIALSAARHMGGNARYLVCDFETGGNGQSDRLAPLARGIAALGGRLEPLSAEDFNALVASGAKEATPEDTNAARQTYLIAIGMDRWHEKPLEVEDSFPSYSMVPTLRKFAAAAPIHGVHLIAWWRKSSAFNHQVLGGGREEDPFDIKVFFRMDAQEVRNLTNPYVVWQAEDNRALVSDPVNLAEPRVFIPFAPVDDSPAVKE